ncbi:MAG: Hsp20/alpha crystallin family protein [Clostridiales bacterium]|nr:Hsp20/alpha crystallin family protein [Clostridiales bacterium]
MRNYLSRRNNDFGFDFFNDAFDEFFKPVFYGVKETSMKTDVKQTDAGFELSIDMPGFDKKDIELSLENGYLKVQAKRSEKEEDEKSFVRRERSFSCSRSYYVGEGITEEDVKAKYNNGTLELFVPKKDKEIVQKKNIAIE